MTELIANDNQSVILTSDEDKCYMIYTRQDKLIGRLNKIGEKPFKVDDNNGHHYKLDLNQIVFKKRRK